ncbi:hypothetical protein GGQ85_003646 [Nitrobacter vulgaris]|uniref:hypothetical protein n=1 Tax=Nitrobacter vulgaris TaxID=29421 RepID=UPI00285DD83E|nr:hypothetical protein [Nitrobacter vulgaris]MDR6305920.1 hypothetical protein [Nitrobacter vulgaris]
MTRQEQIDLIRAACIEANPSDATLRDQTSWQGLQTKREHGRPVRLADVLLAMEAGSTYGDSLNLNFDGSMEYCRVNLPAGPEPEQEIFKGSWNLRKDDLSEQSDECVAYLAQLLG